MQQIDIWLCDGFESVIFASQSGLFYQDEYSLQLSWALTLSCCSSPADGCTFLILGCVLCSFFPLPVSCVSAPEVNGLQEPSLAKRLRGTPERIELENYRLSLQREEELEEVPEETLAEHNLSSVLDKPTDADLGSRSGASWRDTQPLTEDRTCSSLII